MQPHHTGLKVRCRSAVASAPGKWCSRQDSHLHWRRSQRRVSSVGLHEQRNWSLPPVLPRRDFLTKEACGCRKEAENGRRSPVLPWTQRAYETCLSAGSTAMYRIIDKMEPPPGIAPGWPAYRADASLTMLWGLWKWSARDDLHVQGCLILSQVGLLFPVNHAPMKMASLTGFAPVISCMRGRHVGWTTPQGQKW